MSSVAIAVLTRDLRVHDNPVLSAAAAQADSVVPVFVLDDAILRSAYNRPNRARFLVECLRDLDSSLEDGGAALVVRRGDWAREVALLASETRARVVHVAGDVSGYAARRLALQGGQLAADVRLEVHDDALLVVPPSEVAAAGKDHMSVFTPYFRQWQSAPSAGSPPRRGP